MNVSKTPVIQTVVLVGVFALLSLFEWFDFVSACVGVFFTVWVLYVEIDMRRSNERKNKA